MHSSAIIENFIQKTVVMIDGVLLQDSACVILDVLYAMHFIAVAWRLTSLTTIKRCFARYGFLVAHAAALMMLHRNLLN
jgi:hypothetical protein